MDQEIIKELQKPEMTEFHKALLSHCQSLVEMSREKMQGYYNKWDTYDQVYRGEVIPDAQDVKAAERKEPVKMIVPITYAQVQTFIAFCFSMFYQRERLFEVNGTGPEDAEPAKKAEAVLAHDLEYCGFDSRLYQLLLDVGRYGVGVLKTAWTHEQQLTTMVQQVPRMSIFGVGLGSKEQVVRGFKTKFLGTKVVNVSPYRFFPDVRLPLSRLQEGEFVASEEEISLLQLRELERQGVVAGIEHVKSVSAKAMHKRTGSRFSFGGDAVEIERRSRQDNPLAIVTEVQCVIDPKKFLVNGKPMDPSGEVQKWNIWYANDQRVIKAEPLGYMHGEFTYDVAEFSQDMQKVCNAGLAETISSLQDVITWFINSRISAVRRTVNNWLVVDPTHVEMEDLSNRGPVIRLKQNATQGRGIDAYIKQLQVQDTTQAHLQDVEMLKELVSLVTGINETALGQFASGRRSATEAKNVASAAAARLKVIARIIFNQTLVPMAKKMVSNSRDGLSEEVVVRITGSPAGPGYLPVDKTALIGNYDFSYFDGTLPTEKQYQADALSEVLQVMLTNPAAGAMLLYNPQQIMDEILELRGVRNPERFHIPLENVLQQQQQNGMAGIQPPGAAPAGAGVQGAPGIQNALAALTGGGQVPPGAG